MTDATIVGRHLKGNSHAYVRPICRAMWCMNSILTERRPLGVPANLRLAISCVWFARYLCHAAGVVLPDVSALTHGYIVQQTVASMWSQVLEVLTDKDRALVADITPTRPGAVRPKSPHHTP